MRDILQRYAEKAHSSFRQAPRVMGVMLVVVLLLLSSTAVAAQQSGRILIDDFEDGDISDWTSPAALEDANPIQGDYSLTTSTSGGGQAEKAIDSEEYTQISYIIRADSGGGYSRVSFENPSGNDVSGTGISGDTITYRDGGSFVTGGPSVPYGTPVILTTEFDWDGGTVEHTARYYENYTVLWESGEVSISASGPVNTISYVETQHESKIDVITANGTDADFVPREPRTLKIETRELVFPDGQSHPYRVILENVSRVTDNATVTSSNSTLLSVDNTNHTITAINDSNATGVVTLNATYQDGLEEYNTTKTVVVAQPSMQNLELLPTGLWRTYAVMSDNTIFALIIAALFSVAAARFAGAFAGLATAEMVIVIGWLGGYVGLGIAMVSVFMCMFIGLNLAANVDYSVTRMERP